MPWLAGLKAVISSTVLKLASRLIGINRHLNRERLEIIWLFRILVIHCILQVYDFFYGRLTTNFELVRYDRFVSLGDFYIICCTCTVLRRMSSTNYYSKLSRFIWSPWQTQKIFSPPIPSRPALGPLQAPIQWVLWFFSGSKLPEPECGHLPPSSAEVKMRWAIFLNPHMPSWGGVRQLYIFTFIFRFRTWP